MSKAALLVELSATALAPASMIDNASNTPSTTKTEFEVQCRAAILKIPTAPPPVSSILAYCFGTFGLTALAT